MDMVNETPGDGSGDGRSREDLIREIAALKEKIAFLEAKLQLVGSITRHDVINQLTAVVGYNELLSMTITDEKLKGFIEKEKTAIDKIRRQFQFAKDYQNTGVEAPRWQSIRNLCSRVGEELDLRDVKIQVETGTAAILADPHLDRVFYHIFENAVVHGEITTMIRISLAEEGTGAVLCIENDGTAIPPQDKEKIFERGFGRGIGWGLFLSRAILAITGMTITETGGPERGVRFEIVLPPGTYRVQDGD